MYAELNRSGAMLSTMLGIVSAESRSLEETLRRVRVMASLKTPDEDLNCIAVGHDLLNSTDISLRDLSIAGMSLRVIRGVYHLRHMHNPNETFEMICKNDDAIIVEMARIKDMILLMNYDTMNKSTRKMASARHESYLQLQAALNHNRMLRQGIARTW